MLRVGNDAGVVAAGAGGVVLAAKLLCGNLATLAKGPARGSNGGIVVDVLDVPVASGRGTGGEEAGALAGEAVAGSRGHDQVLVGLAGVEAGIGVGGGEGSRGAGTGDRASGAAAEDELTGDGPEVVDLVGGSGASSGCVGA